MKEQLSIFSLIDFNKEPDKQIPPNISFKKNQIWCPYCSTKVVFKRDKNLGVKKCPICGITIKDYWVKKVNNLL